MRSHENGLFSNQRGFTLLEMLIVISIAGVLAAVAVPRFTNAVMLANTARVQSDLQVLNAAIVLYQAETGKNPSAVGDLESYVMDIKNVKPPRENARCGRAIQSTLRTTLMRWQQAEGKRLARGKH